MVPQDVIIAAAAYMRSQMQAKGPDVAIGPTSANKQGEIAGDKDQPRGYGIWGRGGGVRRSCARREGGA